VEVELVQEVQKPLHARPKQHDQLRREVLSFAENGRLTAGSLAYKPVFKVMQRTACGIKHGVNVKAGGALYVSTDFVGTVWLPQDKPDDRYERAVNWILWSPTAETALIISPFEAEELVGRVRAAKVPRTHLLVYAAATTRKMLCFDDLKFYAVPSLPASWTPPKWLTRDLGIFAGRLYFQHEAHEEMSDYLLSRSTWTIQDAKKKLPQLEHKEETAAPTGQPTILRFTKEPSRLHARLADGQMEG